MKELIQKILSKQELALIKKLSTPQKIQDFLDSVPFNFELKGETYMSPRRMLEKKKAHCFEGAIFAYLALQYHGIQSYLVDLKVKKSAKEDSDHIICIFKMNNYWGAISKTNHSVLRWRDPIYKSIRELAMSFYHEYFLSDGVKTIESFSKPFDLFKKFGTNWITETEDLDNIALAIDKSPHIDFVPLENRKMIRRASKTEIKGANIVEWTKKGKRL